ncbi:MAG: hypothetical protein MPN21_24795 [Thermoanaerobaculia bacterium]|nr:hypothetical protein [Thermoanaerobaculia bacterium]
MALILVAWMATAATLLADDSPTPPLDGWQGADVWLGNAERSSELPSGAMVTLIGRGVEDGVRSVADAIAGRIAIFDAVVGLEGPVDPVTILWVEDESIAQEFGGAAGWVRRLTSNDSDDDALGGEIWIVTGDAGRLESDLVEAVDRHQVLTRAAGLPGLLQASLLDLLSATTWSQSHPHPTVTVGSIESYLETLRGLREWDSLAVATATPWSSTPSETRTLLRPQGWAFLHYFLLARESGRQQLQETLEITRRGAVFPAALQEAIIRPPDKLMKKVVRPYAVKGDLEAMHWSRPVTLPEVWRFQPQSDRILVEFGRLQRLRDRHPAAETLFARAEALDGPSKGGAAAGVAFAAVRRGDHKSAEEAFGRAASAEAIEARWPREQARAILEHHAGEPDEASTRHVVELLRTSLDLDSRPREAWTELAVAVQRRSAVDAEWIDWAQSKYGMATEARQGEVAIALYALYEKAGRQQDAEGLAELHPEVRALPVFWDRGATEMAEATVIGDAVTIEGAMELMRLRRYEEALAALEILRAHTQANDSWTTELGKQIAELRRVVAHNRFVDAYNEAARLFNEGQYREATEVLEPVLGDVQDPERRARGEKLMTQSLEWAEKSGQ